MSSCRILPSTNMAQPAQANVAVATRLILLEFCQWKSSQVSDIYNRVQFLNRQKSPKESMSPSFGASSVTVKF